MPINIQKYIAIAVMFGLYSVSVFYAGYFKKGAVEAEKTTEVVLEAIEAEVVVQDDLIDIGLKHADVEVDIKVQNRLNEEEVKRRVKDYIASNSCLTPAGVRRIDKALGYPKGKNNKKSP